MELEPWTGDLIGRMHNEEITYEQLADELGVTKSYTSMILNGSIKPEGIRERMETAVDSIIQKIERSKNEQINSI